MRRRMSKSRPGLTLWEMKITRLFLRVIGESFLQLSYSEEPLIKEGIKIAQIDAEEVKTQVANWSSAVICMVLGANPLFAVFEGFIQRMWGKLEIAQIVRMNGGFTIVKFNDDATRDHVLEHRVIPFDRKSGEAKQWVKKEVKRGGSRQEKTWDIVDQTKTKGAKVMGADEKDKEEVRMGNEFRIQGGDTLGNSGVQVLVRQRVILNRGLSRLV
ncbi:hypothetical protein F8388_005534 [Cannabis sativa]|uniref:DUF4283 domain-containing protein n=1 Tax=Cannabis sativa TaxID=3483 RepID=A0A7J6GYA0_CANSA|nr:hypothetical protein F8388_005534 [Cannabis sativa]